MAYFFASPLDVDVKLEGEELRKQVEVKSEKDKTVSCPVYYDGDSVTGQVGLVISAAAMLSDLLDLNPRSLFVFVTERRQHTRESRWNLWAVLVRRVTPHETVIILTRFQSSSTIEAIIMNSCPYHKNWQRLGRCDKPKRLTSTSRMWRSSLKVTRELMSSYGTNIRVTDIISGIHIRPKVLCARVHISTNGRCGQREGHMGPLLPYAP